MESGRVGAWGGGEWQGEAGEGRREDTVRKPDTEPKTLRNAARNPTGRETETQKDGDPESIRGLNDGEGGSRHCKAGEGRAPRCRASDPGKGGKIGWMWGPRESDRDPERDRDPETGRQRARRDGQRSRSKGGGRHTQPQTRLQGDRCLVHPCLHRHGAVARVGRDPWPPAGPAASSGPLASQPRRPGSRSPWTPPHSPPGRPGPRLLRPLYGQASAGLSPPPASFQSPCRPEQMVLLSAATRAPDSGLCDNPAPEPLRAVWCPRVLIPNRNTSH